MLNNWIEYATVTIILPWQLCYPNNFVTLIYPDNFVTLTTLLPWQLCYTNNFVTLTTLPSNMASTTTPNKLLFVLNYCELSSTYNERGIL